MFETLKPLPPDAILGIMTLFRADPHPGKIDLSVGVYQDEQGRTPVLASVKTAEKAILEKQDSKTYVAIAGNAGFNRGVEEILYGKDHPALKAGRISTVQTPGGSGGLSVAGHLVARARPGARLYVSDPTWPNHQPLLEGRGLAARHLSLLRLRQASRRFRADVGAPREGECRRARADSRLLSQPVRRGPFEGAVGSA